MDSRTRHATASRTLAVITPMEHQLACARHWVQCRRGFNNGDPGTGKTISSLMGYRDSMKGRMLVVAPLSILRPAWGADIDKALEGFSWAVATQPAANRIKAFESGADIVLINHDGVKWLADNLHYLDSFSHGTVDEYTAFKNRTTHRSKAMAKIAGKLEYILLLSGTPNSNKITDLWFPASLVDGGARLGRQFHKFQRETCEARPVPGVSDPRAVEWVEKPGARDAVAILLNDITIRHTLEDCVDIPENTVHMMHVDMPASIMRQYKILEKEAVLALEEGTITAIHAGSKTKKILQLLTGAVYDAEGKIVKVHNERYKLVIDLLLQREHSIVAFNFRHEREELCKLAESAGLTYAVIDGSVTPAQRLEAVDAFQRGDLNVIFAHPQSAGHGLTLTRGTTTIWASPTYNAEHFQQFNARIYRKGQTQKTETICICANNTKEEDVYDKLNGKLERMQDLLAIFASQTRMETAA